jgi:hypothetical protein
MNFRIFTLVGTPDFQFVRIYKNGNSSVTKSIFNTYKKEEITYNTFLEKKPRFCIIRDPYERFISGLKFDLWRLKVDIKDVNIKKLFTSNELHVRNQMTGDLKHTVSQIPYLLNSQISHYIDIEDLNIFLKMHFSESVHEYKFTDLCKEEKFNDIEKHLDKEEIMKYLNIDYYVYNEIKRSCFLWDWQNGKIF